MYIPEEEDHGDPIAKAVIQPRNFCDQVFDPSRTVHTISIEIPKSECTIVYPREILATKTRAITDI